MEEMNVERAAVLLLLGGTCCAAQPELAPETPLPPDPVARAQALLDSTVRIHNEDGAGAGFMIAPGIVVTAKHVAVGAHDGLRVTGRHGHECTPLVGHYVGGEDLAFIWVDGCDDVWPLTLVDHEVLEGLPVIAAGHPLLSDWSIEDGVIADTDVEVSSPADDEAHLLQLSVPINRGMSGGPVVDEHGHVVGLIVGIHSPDGFWAGISFAIPAARIEGALAAAIVESVVEGAAGL